MDFPEVVVTADSSNQNNNCFIYDLSSAALIANFKGGNSSPKCLSFIKDDFLISGLMCQPTMKVWAVTSKRNEKKMSVPGAVLALAVSNCGSYCIAAIEKIIHIWEIETGLLLATFTKHYQDITCLRFSSDGSQFISGGKDALVFVWNLSQQISIYDGDEKGNPHFSWSHHTAEITDIFVSSLSVYSRVTTASVDMTCRIYELCSGMLLLTVNMDVCITSVVMDPSEYFLLLGGINGKIFKINLFVYEGKDLHYDKLVEKCEVEAHKGKITCLSMSQLGLHFLSGSDDKACKLWDIRSLSCLRSFLHDGPVTNAFIALKPLALLKDNIVQSSTVSNFEREVLEASVRREEVDNTKYEIFKKVLPQKLSLMHADSPDELFSYAILHGSYEERKRMSNLKVSVQELHTINTQMYSHALNELFNDMLSPVNNS